MRPKGSGRFCIEPSNSTLQADVNNGTLGVQLAVRYWDWPSPGYFIEQIVGSNLTNECPTNYFGVEIEELDVGGAVPSTGSGAFPSNLAPPSTTPDFTVMFE